MAEGERRERIIGEKQGEKKNKIEIARKLLKKGMSKEEIQEITELTGKNAVTHFKVLKRY